MNPKELDQIKEDISIIQEDIHKLSKKIDVISSESNKHVSLSYPATVSDSIVIKSVYEIPITINLLDTSAAVAANYGYFFTANKSCEVSSLQIVYKTAGTDGSAVTLNIESLTGTTVLGSGTELLTSALSLKATAATIYSGDLISGIQKFLSKGDRLAFKLSGTPTSVNMLQVTIGIRYI